MKKKAISLIEMIVCLSLFSLLLSTLFFWYHSANNQKLIFNRIKWPIIEEHYAHQRLQFIFSSAELPFFNPQFEKNHLVFVFDRGPHTLPELSGKVLARLYFDKVHECLCLGMWPLPIEDKPLRTPSETLVILDGINQCSFSFYHPPDPFKKTVDPHQIGKSAPVESWQEEWKSTYSLLPALVKIKISRNPSKGISEHTFEYAFDLSSKILYSKETT